ncbi:tail fiber domain-containing protein [Methylosinus sp. PW1]|uniref:tail fiber domain-containing protein n=1 Tax=Methylosinus sp. PW1 TaxID=107636 RepID=UPI0009FF1DD9|nr:tail fiber domain-containing protein [Methylosinus sp. PW1]
MGKSSGSSNSALATFAAAQQADAANKQTALGQDWLDFSKQQFGIANDRQAANDALTKQVTDSQLTAQNQANTWAAEDRDRYKSVFQPLQDKFIEKANNWDSADNQAKAAAEAKADVANNVALQDQQRERAMAAKGVRPDSGAWAGIDRAAGTEGALAEAGAQNVARNNLRTQAVSLQADAINMGNGLPSSASSNLSLGVNAGSSANSNNLSTQQSWLNNQSIMNTGYSGASSANSSAGNMWGNIYNNATSQANYQAQQNASGTSALLGGLGSLAGLGLGLYKSDEDAKEDKREVRGILDALKKMPVSAWRYKDGQDRERHVGVMAQDFQRETGLGDGRSIHVVDALGVVMGGVQELAEQVEKLKGKSDNDEKKPVNESSRTMAKSIMSRRAA